MFDALSYINKMKEYQSVFEKTQVDIISFQETAESGGGAVKITVDGKKTILSLDIEDDVLKDKSMTITLLTSAFNKASQQMDDRTKNYLEKTLKPYLPDLPKPPAGGVDASQLLSMFKK